MMEMRHFRSQGLGAGRRQHPHLALNKTKTCGRRRLESRKFRRPQESALSKAPDCGHGEGRRFVYPGKRRQGCGYRTAGRSDVALHSLAVVAAHP